MLISHAHTHTHVITPCFYNEIDTIMMDQFKLLVCLFFGGVSTLQTLNSRFLFRSLSFSFYSTIFLAQRLVIMMMDWGTPKQGKPAQHTCTHHHRLQRIPSNQLHDQHDHQENHHQEHHHDHNDQHNDQHLQNKKKLNWQNMRYIFPYSLIMCSINLLSSYCVTVMPIAAFMAFKKFVILFVLIIGIVCKVDSQFGRFHYWCIGGIVGGGLLIGYKDIAKGQFMGYVASLVYTLCQALALQYSTYLYQKKGIAPRDRPYGEQLLLQHLLLSDIHVP